MTKACLGKKLENFRKGPILLFAFLNTFFKCSSNVKLTSKITPRCLLELTWGNIVIVEKERRMCRLF